MSGRVLIADPNLNGFVDLEKILRQQNYEVEKVNTGSAVVTKVCEFQPHILILSVIMPEVVGYKICETIKSNPDLKDTAVILTFGEKEPFDYQEARRVGATRYLPKSIEPGLLASILNFVWSGVTNVKYMQSVSDHYLVQTMEGFDGPEQEDLPDIDVVEDEEFLDDIEIEDIDEEQIETIEVEDEKIMLQSFEVEEEEQFFEKQEVVQDIPLNLNINEKNKEIELPGLEVTTTPTGRHKQLEKMLENNDLGEVFEPPIVGDQFEYHTEDLEDPLQIKYQLNSISCRDCGATVLTEDVFCIECGAAVDETAIEVPSDLACKTCGLVVNVGDIFCLNCGSVQ